ncbi:hypothetical protein ACH4CD_28810 [Streptomyces fungicidicus]|uniref:hypothetical protein n=1 Tax=Streptomyces fungicidicus TaxID=68203 RepID=UPI00379E23F2
MIENPAPIPSSAVPAGAVAWSSGDAAEWARARPPAWARPLWAVLALLGAVGWAIGVEPVPVCGDAAPCGPDWAGMAQVGLAAGCLIWLAAASDLVLVAAPVLGVMVTLSELPGAGASETTANLAVLGALAFGWAGALRRVTGRRRQRELAERAAGGTRHPVPRPLRPLRRGAALLTAGALLCAVSGAAVALGLEGIRADERRAARATAAEGQVLGRHAESVRVRLDGSRAVEVAAGWPEDYPVGGTVTVLEDGEWRRLAAEPYDAFGWQALVLAAGLPGVSLLASGAPGRLPRRRGRRGLARGLPRRRHGHRAGGR